MTSLKNCSRADDGRERTHSVAMTFQYMECVHHYIQSILAKLSDNPANDTGAEREECVKALCYLAFSTTGWNLWTRYSLSAFLH